MKPTYEELEQRIVELENKKIALELSLQKDKADQIKAEEEFKISNLLLQSILDNLQDAFFRADKNGKFSFVNNTAVSMYGYNSIEEMIGLPAEYIYVNKSDREQIINELRSNNTVNDKEILSKRKDSSEFWISMNGKFLFDLNNEIIGTEGILRDITERKKAKELLIEQNEILERQYEEYYQLNEVLRTTNFELEMAKTKAEESESHLQLISDNLPVLIAHIDMDFKYLFANQYYQKYIGKKPEDIVGKKISDIFSLSVYNQVEPFLQKALKGEHCTFEFSTQFENKEFIFESSYIPEFKNGDVIGIFIMSYDLTEIKNRKKSIIESETRLKLATKAGNIGVWDWDIINDNLVWDDSMYMLYGLNKDDFSGAKDAWLKSLHPDDKNLNEKEIIAALKAEREYSPEFRIIQPNGEIRIIQAASNTFRDNDGKAVRMIGTNIDITDRKKIELALKENELRFKAFIDQSPVSIGVFNLQGFGLYANRKFMEILGLKSLDEVIGRPAYEYFTHQYREDSKERTSRRMLGLPVASEYESICLRSDGKEFPVLNSVASIQLGDETVSIAFLTDITERKQSEKKLLEQNQALERQYEEYMQLNEVLRATNYYLEIQKAKAEESDKLKTAFLQNMSHEIRTPLNGIIGFSNLLLDDNLTKDDINEFTDVIQKSANRLMETIGNILDISKIETGQIDVQNKSFSLNSLMENLFNFFTLSAENKNIELELEISLINEESYIVSDELKLNQILSNLINNSIKFTKDGNIKFGYKINNTEIEFYVKDTGTGIPDGLKHRIFTRFAQVNLEITRGYEGAGLGLSICKGLVELLGGKIWFESDGFTGSTFYFTIPLINSDEIFNKTDIITKTGSIKDKIKILIAEDDSTSYQYLNKILSDPSYLLIHAVNGQEAIDIVKENPDINLILMDIRMPVLNGIEATKIIKNLRPDLPIIAQTAYAFSSERDAILSIGCIDYISKPIRKEELFELIGKYV